jgi:hypothetical protein
VFDVCGGKDISPISSILAPIGFTTTTSTLIMALVEGVVRADRRGEWLSTAPAKGDAVEQRLIRLEREIFALSAGLIKQRKQIGAGVAVNLTGHLLTNKSLSSVSDKRRR